MATQGGEPEGNLAEKHEAACRKLHQEEDAGLGLSNQDLTTYLLRDLEQVFWLVNGCSRAFFWRCSELVQALRLSE